MTIAEAGLRSQFGVSILAMKRMGRDGHERRFVPGPPERLLHGDVLVVLGSDDSLAQIARRTSAFGHDRVVTAPQGGPGALGAVLS